MRRFWIVLAGLWLAPMAAWADETIAGQWQASLGHNVIIAMDVLADGHWASQTIQSNRVVAEMAGTYEQKKDTATTGTLVFTPIKATITTAHGSAEVETDRYALEQDSHVLRLTTGKDVMVFQKQALKP